MPNRRAAFLLRESDPHLRLFPEGRRCIRQPLPAVALAQFAAGVGHTCTVQCQAELDALFSRCGLDFRSLAIDFRLMRAALREHALPPHPDPLSPRRVTCDPRGRGRGRVHDQRSRCCAQLSRPRYVSNADDRRSARISRDLYHRPLRLWFISYGNCRVKSRCGTPRCTAR